MNLLDIYELLVFALSPQDQAPVLSFNPYPAGNECASKEPGQILLTDQFQILIFISLKMIMDSIKNGRWIIPLTKFSKLRLISVLFSFSSSVIIKDDIFHSLVYEFQNNNTGCSGNVHLYFYSP